jgi:hypothetical protein
MRNRILFVATTILAVATCGLLNPWVREAQGQSSSWDLPEFKEAAAALGRWDCKTAWEIYWPLAKAGNAEARYALRTSMIYNMNPPGVRFWSTSPAIWARHSFTLAAYGALARPRPGLDHPDHKGIRNDIPIHLKELALGAKGDQVAQCYKSGGAFRDCLDLALSLGVVPKFEDYAEEVERAERETGRPASCWDPHGTLKP